MQSCMCVCVRVCVLHRVFTTKLSQMIWLLLIGFLISWWLSSLPLPPLCCLHPLCQVHFRRVFFREFVNSWALFFVEYFAIA